MIEKTQKPVLQGSQEGVFKQAVQDIKSITGVDVLQNKKKRSQSLAELRFMLMYMLKNKGFTVRDIALLLGKKHSTVVYGVRRSEEIMSFDKEYKRTFRQIMELNKSEARENDIKAHLKYWYS